MRKPIITVIALLAPRAALACPVCFGQNDSPLAAGINWGIFAMLAVTGGVLVCFATFFIHPMRRARLVDRSESAAAAGARERYVGSVQGGSA